MRSAIDVELSGVRLCIRKSRSHSPRSVLRVSRFLPARVSERHLFVRLLRAETNCAEALAKLCSARLAAEMDLCRPFYGGLFFLALLADLPSLASEDA